jgi:hypothetical protein
MIEELAAFIDAHTSLIYGTNLFIGHLPKKTAAGTIPPARHVIILENNPGALDFYVPESGQYEYQFLCESNTYLTARADAYEIFRFLHGTAGWELPIITSGEFYRINSAAAVAPPASVTNPSEAGTFAFSVNFILNISRD